MAKIKTVKGVPSKKDNGFLSIERAKGASLYYLVYRNFLGANQFSGLISSARIKEVNEKPGKIQAKAALLQREAGKLAPVHLMINFITEGDRQTFIKVFSSLLSEPCA